MPRGKLSEYEAKRDFRATPEPSGDGRGRPKGDAPRFVVQQHHATRLHWDLRLEHAGALASWAIPNGIPPDPAENRLAVLMRWSWYYFRLDRPVRIIVRADAPQHRPGAGNAAAD